MNEKKKSIFSAIIKSVTSINLNYVKFARATSPASEIFRRICARELVCNVLIVETEHFARWST